LLKKVKCDVIEISLAEFGLETVADVCARKGWAAKTFQNWVKADLLPVVPVGGGRGTYLLRKTDIDSFTPPPRGRPKAEPEEPKKKPAAKKGKLKK